MNTILRKHSPWYRKSNRVDWISAIVVGAFGIYLLFQSYSLAGTSLDWRVSAGVAAVSLFCLKLLESIAYPSGFEGFALRNAVALVLAGVGLALLATVAYGQWSEWARTLLLEFGISCLFVAAVDYYIGALQARAYDDDREEKKFFAELMLAAGLSFDLTLWKSKLMQDFLGMAIESGQGRTFTDRIALLIRALYKAKNLPEHLDLPKSQDFKQEMAREWLILELCCEAAIKMRLTDNEHRYLAAVIATRFDPDRVEPIDIDCLPTVVENSAELITKKRRRGLYRLAFWRQWDPLSAHGELAERANRIPDRLAMFETDE